MKTPIRFSLNPNICRAVGTGIGITNSSPVRDSAIYLISSFQPSQLVASAPSRAEEASSIMGRTAGNFCSRESMYRFQDDMVQSDLAPLIDTEQPNSDALTWQQQEYFGLAVVSETGPIAIHDSPQPTPHRPPIAWISGASSCA